MTIYCRDCAALHKRFCFEHQERAEPSDCADDCPDFRHVPATCRSARHIATLIGLTLLIGWRPNVQVEGRCGNGPAVVAESDSLGIVAVETDGAMPCSWQTVGTGVPGVHAAQGCKVEAR